jgi:hypothetical protein
MIENKYLREDMYIIILGKADDDGVAGVIFRNHAWN